jgi:hypothetical protein
MPLASRRTLSVVWQSLRSGRSSGGRACRGASVRASLETQGWAETGAAVRSTWICLWYLADVQACVWFGADHHAAPPAHPAASCFRAGGSPLRWPTPVLIESPYRERPLHPLGSSFSRLKHLPHPPLPVVGELRLFADFDRDVELLR